MAEWRFLMEKEQICEIKNKLRDVPGGKYLAVRHPLEDGDPTWECPPLELPATAQIKTETYELYPGIELSHNYFLADRFHFHHHHKGTVLSVDHCRRGRIGWEMRGGLSLYFGSGDLSFHATDKCSDSFITLPLGYYEGLSVSMDPLVLKEQCPSLLKEAQVDTAALCRKFCGSQETAALPASSCIEHIFSEVYDLPERMKLPYLKLKCQELLMFLSMTEAGAALPLDPYHSEQVEIIRRIHDQITDDLSRRYTIDGLARQYHINSASLKEIFKSVYGMPVASYMKQYRISRAAVLLRETGDSIAAISRAVGYESQSKFSAAFKDIMKILPTDYRRQYL